MKPLTRGYIHFFAFFGAIVASVLLILHGDGVRAQISNVIYCITLIGLFGVSALFHFPMWSRRSYRVIKSIDHAAIFALIAGSATPVCLLGIKGETGLHLLAIMWVACLIGMLMTIFWAQSPKWIRALFYVVISWLAVFYFPEMKSSLSVTNIALLLIGGVIYTMGALVYAFKWPNPSPRVFGYHEVFHLFIVIASGFHFKVIYNLTT